MTRYRHTQVGYLTTVALALGLALAGWTMFLSGFNWVGLGVLIILAVCLVLFPTLTALVLDDRVEVRFGPGLIRRRFRAGDIESCRVVRNPWYYGWGIRLIPHGWMFNVSGLRAVELAMKNGRRYRIGTDAPEDLARAIQQVLKQA